jgi:Ca2+-binding RTX toxin-like protein
MLGMASTASASHLPSSCTNCASHKHWPTPDGLILMKRGQTDANYKGTWRSDQLTGHQGSDTLRGMGGSDILWGNWDPVQRTDQYDVIYGGTGNDFIYGSHGHNRIFGGPGNDAISVHYGRGVVDCGPGRDIYHVAKSRRKGYTFRNCEKVDYRPERVRGGGLRPLR